MNNRKKVLVVDDQKIIADVMDAYLKQCGGARLLYAENGQQAIQLAKDEAPDLIFLDIMMPGIDGYKVCRYLKGDPDTRDIPVIFLTAGQDRAEALGAEAGGDGFVGKPFVAQEILSVLSRYLGCSPTSAP